MSPEEELRRANEARHILEAPLFKAARAELYEKLRQARRQAPIGATELHTKLIMMEQLADQIFDYFELVLQTGKLAEHHLAQSAQQNAARQEGLHLFRTMGRDAF